LKTGIRFKFCITHSIHW